MIFMELGHEMMKNNSVTRYGDEQKPVKFKLWLKTANQLVH